MKSQEIVWSNIVKTPDSVFEYLCKLTLQVCNRTEFPAGTFSEKGNRWVELAAAWDRLIDGGSARIFLDVVHRTMWGFPYSLANPDCENITRIVHYELMRDREAFNAWDECDSFIEALITPANEGTPWVEDLPAYHCSIDHYEYLCTRMLYKLRFSKRKYSDERVACENAWGEYHRSIGRIIPAAKGWNEVQWANEDNIHNEIRRLYGVDYREDLDSYYYLYAMLTRTDIPPVRRLFTEAWYAHKIKTLPMSLAKVLWPDDMKSSIVTMFITAGYMVKQDRKKVRKAGKHADKKMLYDYQSFYNSWLYRIVEEWHKTGVDDMPVEVGTILTETAKHLK